MIAVNGIVSKFATDLTCWPIVLRFVVTTCILTMKTRLVLTLWAWRRILSELVLRIEMTRSAIASASSRIVISSSASIVVRAAIGLPICIGDKHSKWGVELWAFINRELFCLKQNKKFLKGQGIISCPYSLIEKGIFFGKAFKDHVQHFLIINLNTYCRELVSCSLDLLHIGIDRVRTFLDRLQFKLQSTDQHDYCVNNNVFWIQTPLEFKFNKDPV